MQTSMEETRKSGYAGQQFSLVVERYGIIFVLIPLIALFGILNPVFLSVANILNVLRQISIFGIMAVGMTMVIMCAQIDLSIGAIVAFSGVISAMVAKAGYPLPASLVAGCAAGLMCGLINGFLTTTFNVHALLITLGSMTAIRGVGFLITGGRPVWGMDPSYKWLGAGFILGIPVPIIIMLIVYAIGWFIMSQTTFGRYIYSTGGNLEAAKLSGINTGSVTMWALGICGLLAGLSGVIWSSRLYSGQPIVGQGYELQVIAATVLGGISLAGGQGEVLATLGGALIIGILHNGLNLLGVSPYWQMVAMGCVIILAVILDSLRRRGE
jgi:ribose/xylose/arabinose/galactoside ABC-type transport system permease subunit